ncbi:MAG: hypothetical protein LC754_10455 [Acidobacteria bacterium]|nr:hypothetical protein [Acidobacteriota bacterium]
MREFETGATRDDEGDKIDYEGFLSPYVLERYGAYMNAHRLQADGALRDSDNWQKGMPLDVYAKSLIRHVFDFWGKHRQGEYSDDDLIEVLCAVLFNAMGYIYELVTEPPPGDDGEPEKRTLSDFVSLAGKAS